MEQHKFRKKMTECFLVDDYKFRQDPWGGEVNYKGESLLHPVIRTETHAVQVWQDPVTKVSIVYSYYLPVKDERFTERLELTLVVPDGHTSRYCTVIRYMQGGVMVKDHLGSSGRRSAAYTSLQKFRQVYDERIPKEPKSTTVERYGRSSRGKLTSAMVALMLSAPSTIIGGDN